MAPKAVAASKRKGRLIGILTGTGGITEIVEEIIRVSGKNNGACILYDEDPKKIIERLTQYYRRTTFGSHPASARAHEKDRINCIESFGIVGFRE
jgi:hypothetical protein